MRYEEETLCLNWDYGFTRYTGLESEEHINPDNPDHPLIVVQNLRYTGLESEEHINPDNPDHPLIVVQNFEIDRIRV